MRGTIAVLVAVALVGAATPSPARANVVGHSERLAARARRGDQVARAKLVEEHMGLIRSVAYRYRGLGLPAEDLVQEGAIGLLAAIEDYDASRGASFSTYAFWRVRAAVTHALTAYGHLVRPPRPLLEQRRQVAEARDSLAACGRRPSVTELVRMTALPPDAIAQALAPTRVASLDQTAVDGTSLADRVAADAAASPDAQLVDSEEATALRGAVHRLRGRKRAIVSRHFGFAGRPETLTEIAEDLHLSPERTRVLKDEALRDLAVELAPVLET